MKKMRYISFFVIASLSVALAYAASTGTETAKSQSTSKFVLQQYGFVDEDGDGINDLARDADNDGIPNCMDPDWVRPQDGTGYQNRHGGRNQNGAQQNGNFYNYSYSHRWNRSGANGNPNFCNQPCPNNGINRGKGPNRGH